MGNVNLAYRNSASLTITASTLANDAARQCTAIDNATNLDLDALVTIRAGIGTVAGTKQVQVYVFATEDASNYDDTTGASDAGVTLEDPTVLNLAAIVPTPTSTKTYEKVFSIAQCFGGVMPRRWGIVVVNKTGAAFTSFAATYSGVYMTAS